MKTLRLALAQINPTVGDIDGNVNKIIEYIDKARALGVSIIAFPELCLTGYPPEDLLLKPGFIEDNLSALDEITRMTEGIIAIVGFVDRKSDIFNSAAIISGKKIIDVYHKIYLPNYGVFDEFRYFQAGKRLPIYDVGGALVGVNICEDIWYPDGPARLQSLYGADIIININASPYTIGKRCYRESMLSMRALDNASIVCYVNMVGGQDELVFDGGSMILCETGDVAARAGQFEEELLVKDLDLNGVFRRRLQDPRRRLQSQEIDESGIEKIIVPMPDVITGVYIPRKAEVKDVEKAEEVYNALKIGVRDYVFKNGFKGVAIGLSGGADSALVSIVATDALGADNVTCIFMPSKYTSIESKEDSCGLVKNLGIKLIEIPIDNIFDGYIDSLSTHFKGHSQDVTEENLQARIRGNILMAFSNKFGYLVLTTGNKSEMSVGYATLYGDMAGGFAVIKDVPKTLVYEILKWKNKDHEVVPDRILSKEPTAELRPNQKDTDSLLPYPVLDPILREYIENEKSLDELVSMGFDENDTRRVMAMVDGSEYKRRQSPPGIKITPRAFGRDRRFPITNKYRGHR